MADRDTSGTQSKQVWRGWALSYETSADPERWKNLQQLAGVKPSDGPVRAHLIATPHAVRCDWELAHDKGQDFGLLLRVGTRPVLYSERSKSYYVLPVPPQPDRAAWTTERTGRTRLSTFGLAEEYLLLPSGRRDPSRLHVWLLSRTELGASLRALWQIVLPPLASANLPSGVPLELCFEMQGDGIPDAVMQLTALSSSTFDPAAFTLEPQFKEGLDFRQTFPVPPKEEEPPKPAPRPPAPPPLLAFALGARQEKAKLLVQSTVFDQAVGLVNFLAGLVGGVSGKGLTLKTGAIYDNVEANAPGDAATPARDRVAPNLLNRILLWLLLDKLDNLLEPMELRQAVTQALDAADTGGDVLGVAPPPNISPERAADFDLIKRYIVAVAALPVPGGVNMASSLDDLRDLWANGDPAEHSTLIRILHLLEAMTPVRQAAMKEWFNLNFSEIRLEPKPPLRQSHGVNEGWAGDTYYRDAVAGVLDLKFTVGLSSISLAGQPAAIDPFTPLTRNNSTIIQALELQDLLLGRPPRNRVGFGTILHLSQFLATATAVTTPTPHSPSVAALIFACPPCVALLWQDVTGVLAMGDVRASAALLFANDPLGIEDPTLELHISGPFATSTDASAYVFNLLPGLSPILNTAFQELVVLFTEFIAPSLLESLAERLSMSIHLPEDVRVRLQPMLNLNRESYQQRLENVARGAEDPFLDQAAATRQLDELINRTPSGQNTVAFRSTFINYDLALSITEPGQGGRLDYPPEAAILPAPITLLLSHGVLQYWLAWAGYGVGYQGDIRLAEDSMPELGDKPVLDFWAHALEPERLGPRPNYRTGPPQVALIPGASLMDWIGYHGIARVTNGVSRILPVSNPAPDDPIAEIQVTVEFDVGVTTFTPVTYQVCEDWTRLAEWLDRGGFGPRIPPLDPGDPVPPWAEGILEVRKQSGILAEDSGPALGPDLLDSLSTALRSGSPLYSPARGLGSGRAGFGHTVACTLITSWDKKSSEQWLSASLSLTVPVLFGLGDLFLDRQRFLPLLTYRIDPSRLVVGELSASAPEGPLAGVLQGGNRDWLIQIMVNHALALLLSDRTIYRLDHPQAQSLAYAYGLSQVTLLDPERFAPRAFIALHPTHWSADPTANPNTETDPPPYMTIETFGDDPERLHLAINFHTITNVLAKIMGA